MVFWVPQKQHELRRVYDLCQALGAPKFLSPDDMHRWLGEHSESVQEFFSSKYHVFVNLNGVECIVRQIVQALREIYSHGNSLAAELKWLVFKALHTPLLLNPRSLHPIDLVA